MQAIARANASNTILPEYIREFEGLQVVEEGSKGARKLFITMLVACGYSALAVSSPGLGPDEAISLPIFQTDIPTWGFFHVTPVLLALLFGYFQLQMQRVWEELAGPPAIFPDGKPIDQKIHPWLMTGLVRAHFPYAQAKPVRYFGLHHAVIILLGWGTVPITIGYLITRFISVFDGAGLYSASGAVLAWVVSAGAVLSYIGAGRTLRGLGSGPLWGVGGGKDLSGMRRFLEVGRGV